MNARLFESFFIVGVSPLKVLRSAKFQPRSTISSRRRSLSERRTSASFSACARRRSRFRPETLLSFPGTAEKDSSSNVALCLVRDRTVLETAICEFCFPNGSTVVELQSTGAAAESREYLYFTVQDSVLPDHHGSAGTPLYCVALKTTELITVKRLIPELMDLETAINSNRDPEIDSQMIEERLSTLAWFASSAEQKDALISWSLPYCYVLVSKFPFFSWHAAFLRLFRDLCVNGGKACIETPRDVPLANLLKFIPWARKTVVPYTLSSVQKIVTARMENQESEEAVTQMKHLQTVVALVMDWFAPVVPVAITKSARSLVALLHHATPETRSAISDYFNASEFKAAHLLKSRALNLLEILGDTKWEPRAARRLSLVYNMFKSDRLQIVPNWKEFVPLNCDLALIHSTDLLIPQTFGAVPMAIFGWFSFMLLQERKVIVTSPSTFRRSAAVFSLKCSLSPHSWPHACIPILPSSVGSGFLDAPVPFLASLRKVPDADTQNFYIYDSAMHRHGSDTRFGKIHKTTCGGCLAHAKSTTNRCCFHATRDLLHLVLQLGEATLDLDTVNSLEWSPQPHIPTDYTTPLRHASSRTSDKAPVSDSITVELMTPPLVDAPWDHALVPPLVSRLPREQACCELTGPLRKQSKWSFKMSSWDGGVLSMAEDDAHMVQLPEVVIDHLSVDRSCLNMKDTKASKSTHSTNDSGDSTVTPWLSIVEGRKMSVQQSPTYRDDWHFLLNHHLEYSRAFLPNPASIPARLSQKWFVDAVKRFSANALLPVSGIESSETLVPAQIEGAVSIMSEIQKQTCSMIDSLDCRISAINQMIYIWQRFECVLKLLDDLSAESSTYIPTSTSTVAFQHTYRELCTVKQEALREECQQLEAVKADLKSVSAAVSLSVWQTNITYPIRMFFRMFSKWNSNPSLYSPRYIWSKQDLLSIFSPRSVSLRADAPLSCIEDEDTLERAASLPCRDKKDVTNPVYQRSQSDTATHANNDESQRRPDIELTRQLTRYKTSNCPDAETANYIDTANIRIQLWRCGPLRMRFLSEQTSASSSTSSALTDRLSPCEYTRGKDENGAREDWQFFLHNLIFRVLFEEFVRNQSRKSKQSIAPRDNATPCACCCEAVMRDRHFTEDLDLIHMHLRELAAPWAQEFVPPVSSGLRSFFKRKRSTVGNLSARNREDTNSRTKRKIIQELSKTPDRDDWPSPSPSLQRETLVRSTEDLVQSFKKLAAHCQEKIDAAETVNLESAEVKHVLASLIFDWSSDIYDTELAPSLGHKDTDYSIRALSEWSGLSVRLSQWKCFMSSLWDSQFVKQP
eukprot:Gregarina_sp_Poly_1__931@NODE_1224_length_4723_cov_22_137672_g833_i0_p1_GENE_NODE_1224_length_4723_cov_22_137672_g833_i0NODE_1224_length_4723_cov_22_137672_g833_i0_p1_ORF_typecomplete_len1311_score173_68DENN/PF02141_21/0_36DENN/PF02141_21/1_8e12uDENN/PF03456_18/0_08_NODE_1224_length_4723_cov_22_137672_g833_i07914723